MKFKIVENIASGDFVFDAYGKTLNELFANCAEACFTAMTNISIVSPEKSFTLDVKGSDNDELLYNFLAELIYLKDIERIFLCEYDIQFEKNRLIAIVKGEEIDYSKHEIKTDVKAVTYYGLKIKQEKNQYSVRVILDL